MTDLRFTPEEQPLMSNFNKRFEKLNNAAFLEKVPLCTKVEVDLANALEGDVIKLKEGGKAVEFYVAKHDYESGLNGPGRTLVVRKDCYDTRVWHSSNVNAYATCTLDTWFNGTYKALLDAEIQAAVGTNKFYYTPGNGDNTVSQLERAVFALSLTELGQSRQYTNVEGTALPIADTLKIAYLNGSAVVQWTRSPSTDGTTHVLFSGADGGVGSYACTSTFGARPCFTLPSDFTMTYYEDADGNLHPEQKYSSSITDLFGDLMTIGTQIETGSYVGTGTYGAADPNSLTFGFVPKMLLFGTGGSSWYRYMVETDHKYRGETATNQLGAGIYFTVAGNVISWYSATSALTQGNNEGKTYDYLALG